MHQHAEVLSLTVANLAVRVSSLFVLWTIPINQLLSSSSVRLHSVLRSILILSSEEVPVG